jgi:hypothetical protein
MNNQQVAHLWANQSRESAKGSNFFFNGKSIWSYGYHFEVGRIVETEKGKEIVLLNGDSYSVSTQRHQSYARQACNHLESFDFPLHNSRFSTIVRHELTNDDMTRAFVSFGKIVIDSVKKAKRSRKYSDLYIKQAEKAINDWNALKAHFPKLTKGIKRLKMPDDHQVNKLLASDKAEKAKQRKEKLEREKRLAEKLKEESIKWLNYERNAITFGSHLKACFLRQRRVIVNGNVESFIDEVETSHGARVPLDKARLFYKAITRFKDNPNECTERYQVGDFRLNKLTSNGAQIGCHFIEWNEIERFAKQMEWSK